MKFHIYTEGDIDIDMECFQNIEPLIEGEEFFVGTEDDYYYSHELMG